MLNKHRPNLLFKEVDAVIASAAMWQYQEQANSDTNSSHWHKRYQQSEKGSGFGWEIDMSISRANKLSQCKLAVLGNINCLVRRSYHSRIKKERHPHSGGGVWCLLCQCHLLHCHHFGWYWQHLT